MVKNYHVIMIGLTVIFGGRYFYSIPQLEYDDTSQKAQVGWKKLDTVGPKQADFIAGPVWHPNDWDSIK